MLPELGQELLQNADDFRAAHAFLLKLYLDAVCSVFLGAIIKNVVLGLPRIGLLPFEELGKNLSMQVAASNPICVSRGEMPQAVIEREKAIFKEEVKGKPENIVEKIMLGKLDKFYQAHCLLEQPFIKDDKTTVQQLISQVGKQLGDTIQVKQFVRFQLGEAVAS